MRKKIWLTGLVALLAIMLGFVVLTPKQCIDMVGHCGYWWTLASVALFFAFLVRSLREDWHGGIAWRFWLWPLVLVAGITTVVTVQEPHGFKMVADEAVLQSTAMRMHFDRSATAVVRGYDIAGSYAAFDYYIDKRPLLFPFLLATVHDLTGYRIANVYWLNGMVTALLFLMLFLIGRRLGGVGAGVASVLLMATLPLISQNASGGGFELLNMLMIATTVWLGMRYAEKPLDADRLAVFVLSGVLLAQARYESALFIVPVAATLVYCWYKTKEIKLTWPLIITPLLLLPVSWQHNVFKVSQSTWQLGDVAGATSPFSGRYFYNNVGHAMNFFLSFDGSQPNSWLLAIAGSFAVGFFLLVLYKKHREIFSARPTEAVMVIFLVSLLGHTLLMLCYFWGAWDDLIISRLSMPAHLLLLWALIFIYPQLVRSARRWQWLCGIAAFYCLGITLPVTARHFYSEQNFSAKTFNWVAHELNGYKGKHVLGIDSQSCVVWPLYHQSAVTLAGVAMAPEKFLYHYENHSFDDYLIVQVCHVDLKTHQRIPVPGDDTGDGFTLQLIAEDAMAPTYVVRLSRVVGLNKAKLDAWAAAWRKHPGDKAVLSAHSATGAAAVSSEAGLDYWIKQLP